MHRLVPIHHGFKNPCFLARSTKTVKNYLNRRDRGINPLMIYAESRCYHD